ncbi:SDR family oxidoreductase [Actinokineospora globicatena]|uniref:Nucleotide-diphosphate-sugar epimerase n=1 Tax=Actinokineospora globicatena TaxID=103729 RepID=A0A9W6V7M2_9PSEU|nr:NAD(P)H-binding protein [Actinokineospora globicatena]GLW91502.1 nucleotide-diphosphate-sugar epimerase [Actinokineospora globicatena]
MSILVTGGTGVLGRQVVRALPDARVLTRSGDGYRGDLLTGAGLEDALAGVTAVVHCATTLGRKDVDATAALIAAAKRSGNPHLVYISIVGVDRIPLPYYRAKLAAERLVEDSGLPYSILRATQFHDLIAKIFAPQRLILFHPAFAFQPVDTGTVATRLADLATGSAQGRVSDLGGPTVWTSRALAGQYLAATGRKAVRVPVWLPGRIFASYRAGYHLAPAHAEGTVEFADFLAGDPRHP